jgi:ABC-type glycerol-3-phosphate transport system permease component
MIRIVHAPPEVRSVQPRPAPARSGRLSLQPWEIPVHAVLLLTAALFLFPFIYIIFTSLKAEADILTDARLLTFRYTLANFRYIAKSGVKIGAYYSNSVILTVAADLLVVLLGSAGGFSFAKFRFAGRKLILGLMLLTMTFPLAAILIPLFILELRLGLHDSLPGLILPNIAVNVPFAIFIMQAIYKSVPNELMDSAEIDGCGSLRTWLYIMLPVSKNGLLVVTILTFGSVWGEYTLAMTLASSARSYPLAVGLTFLKEEYWHFGIMSAVILLAIVPPVIVFLFFRKHFQRGIAIGALKG